MFEDIFLLVFCFVLAIGGLATVVWELVTGRFFNIDGLWLALISLTLSVVFGGNIAWSIYTGELQRILHESPKRVLPEQRHGQNGHRSQMIHFLPLVDATLNAASAVLLVCGFYFIRQKNIPAHRACMLSAFATSILFLICYLTYHYFHGVTRFPGHGFVRTFYLTLLGSHTILAVVIVPLVLTTLYRALRRRFDRHRRIAVWTLPLWLYVSVTGVVVYWMLYHFKTS